jgi:hypothetical protein
MRKKKREDVDENLIRVLSPVLHVTFFYMLNA